MMDLQSTIERACTVATAQMPGSLKSIALDHLDELSDEEKAAVEWAAEQMLIRQRYVRGLAGRVVT